MPLETVSAAVSGVISMSARLLMVILGGVSLALATVFLYRLYLHPLSRVPGPKLAALSSAWQAYHVRNGQMTRVGKQLHRKYGHAVRVGPSEVWFDSEDAFRSIYSKLSELSFGVTTLTN